MLCKTNKLSTSPRNVCLSSCDLNKYQKFQFNHSLLKSNCKNDYDLLALDVAGSWDLLGGSSIGGGLMDFSGRADGSLFAGKFWAFDNAEECIHLLERDTLGLWDEEPDEEELA